MKKTLLLFCCCLLQYCLMAQTIHRIACKGDLSRLDSLLTTTSIDIEDGRGRSLLHWAVACKQKEVFDFLIQKGIAINATDHQGKTPLHVAVTYNNAPYLQYLIEAQPQDGWQATYGVSLLERAVLNKNKTTTAMLLHHGVDINGTNKRGSTPLEIAQRIGATDLSSFLIAQGSDPKLVRKIRLKGKYMGLKALGTTPRLLAPNFISTEEEEFGAVFNKKGTAFYFAVDVGKRNEIRCSKLVKGRWTKPTTLLSHEHYSYNDPFLSNDEQRLYFISKQTLDGKGPPKDVDIWYIEKKGQDWSEPIHAGAPINTSGDEYYISFTENGTLYFASNGQPRTDTTRTDHDIYYSKLVDQGFQTPVLLDSAINTTGYEADVFVTPDESYLIFCSIREGGFGRGDLLISFKRQNGTWTKAVNMGPKINTEHYEYCPFVTKNGRYLLYTSNQDIYVVSTAIIQELRQSIEE